MGFASFVLAPKFWLGCRLGGCRLGLGLGLEFELEFGLGFELGFGLEFELGFGLGLDSGTFGSDFTGLERLETGSTETDVPESRWFEVKGGEAFSATLTSLEAGARKITYTQ